MFVLHYVRSRENTRSGTTVLFNDDHMTVAVMVSHGIRAKRKNIYMYICSTATICTVTKT